jgi:hypothetical protein
VFDGAVKRQTKQMAPQSIEKACGMDWSGIPNQQCAKYCGND